MTTNTTTKPDFDDEARKIFQKLNLDAKDGSSGSRYRDLDPVWKHPKSGACVYIGNKTAAHSRDILKKHGITCIVNCTKTISNAFEETAGDEKGVAYYNFIIYRYLSELDLRTDRGVLEFFMPVFSWIDKQVSEGRSVLIHCLAGAHRAGTTGTAYVMHAAKIYDHETAVAACKKCRPVVNPIYGMRDLLRQLGIAMRKRSG